MAFLPPPTPLVVDTDTAAALTGVSAFAVREAVRNNDLVARYPNNDPHFLVSDLLVWVESWPTEKKA
ncbi:hypothetical protein ACUIAC_00850 [Dermabacteraceae bacterium P13138]